MVMNLEHSGSGDIVLGNKYENIIRSIQARDLMSVTDSIMRDICYRDLGKALEKLNALSGISALETDVQLLLSAISLKAALVKSSCSPSKNDLVKLLQQHDLPVDIREVVTAILIDLESRTSEELARERYSDLQVRGIYTKEVFYERLASKEELNDSYRCSKAYDLSEQEVTGLVRGAIRVGDFELAFELSQLLNKYFSSSNSATLLLYVESLLLYTKSQKKSYISLSKEEKINIDSLVDQLLINVADKDDRRIIATLVSLLYVTQFSDGRLNDLSKLHIDKIREQSPECAEHIEQLSNRISSLEKKFELASDSLDLEQFKSLDLAIRNDQIKVNDVKKWIDRGGLVLSGDDYINSFLSLYLSALVCSLNDKKEVDLLDKKSQCFLELDAEKFVQLNPYIVLELCEKFMALGLPLNTVKYLEPFLSSEAWVSQIFECYLTALWASEQFNLFLSKVKHLDPEDKTALIFLREAQVYELLNEYQLSIEATRSAIEISPNIPYAWHLLLHASRANGLSKEELVEIVFEIPEEIFATYSESGIPLVNEIATYIDINLADRVLVDWFSQNPDEVATGLTQIHFNSLNNRPEVTNNPYVPRHCCDGVKYTDGFETFTRLLVRDVDSSHPLLLNIEAPLGKILNRMQEGDVSDDYKMIERLPSYVAAFRHAGEIRHKGNDGTDAFRIFSVPDSEGEFIPYFESILKRCSSKEPRTDELLQNPHISLMMRGHYTDQGNPVQGAIKHLSSSESTQYIKFFTRGEENPDKVIIDVYTAVYLSLMGLASTIFTFNLEVVLCQHTKKILESWVEDVSRDDYMSVGLSEHGLYRTTSEDIKRGSAELILGLKTLLKYSKVEALKPADTPEILVKIRGMVPDTAYTTLQLSAANDIPLLCIDHLIMELLHNSGMPAANMDSFFMRLSSSLSLKERKKSIQLNLYSGTPACIFHKDIVELSCSSEPSDRYLVFKFLEKYGETIDEKEERINFLIVIVKNVLDAVVGQPVSPQYFEHVFNSCCRVSMKILVGKTAEERFATFIYSVIYLARKYTKIIRALANNFATGHFLDVDACNDAITLCHEKRTS